jgi:hypothetical protein
MVPVRFFLSTFPSAAVRDRLSRLEGDPPARRSNFQQGSNILVQDPFHPLTTFMGAPLPQIVLAQQN